MAGPMPPVDVLLVSLGGPRACERPTLERAGSIRRAGAVRARAVPSARELRTFAWLEFDSAVNARRATSRAVRELSFAAVIYSTTRRRYSVRCRARSASTTRRCQPPGPPRRLAAPGRGAPLPGDAAARAVEPGGAGGGARATRGRRGAGTGRAVGTRRRPRHRRDHLRRQPAQEGPGPRALGVAVGGAARTRSSSWRAWTSARARSGSAARRRRRAPRSRRRPTRGRWPRAGGGRTLSPGAHSGRGDRAVRGPRPARGVPGAAAALARISLRAAAGGLRDRAARGTGGRVRARHHAARPARTSPRRSRGGSTTGWSARGSRSGPRSTRRGPTTVSALLRRSSRSRRGAVDRVVAEDLLPRLLTVNGKPVREGSGPVHHARLAGAGHPRAARRARRTGAGTQTVTGLTWSPPSTPGVRDRFTRTTASGVPHETPAQPDVRDAPPPTRQLDQCGPDR